MYASLCPNGNGEVFAAHIFRAFDLDRSNTVDFREFLIGLSMTSTCSPLETKLHWIFHVFDIDGNGLLTRNECLEVIDVIIRFNSSKEDHNEEQPEVERLIRSAKKSMMRIFDNISDSHCNTLTITQFVDGCVKDEFISKLLAPNSIVGNDPLVMENTMETTTAEESITVNTSL
jgi:Ca2+-binding EF-hand superfamily protein